jgi:glycosyltransferase involved in cell wall biosynthesis
LRLLLVVDVFLPTYTSASVQMYDLAVALARLGHECIVVTPDPCVRELFALEPTNNFSILRIRSVPLKQIKLVRRAINELFLSTNMWQGYRGSPVASEPIDGVIFYSPSIFFGRFIAKLKVLHGCRAYLILRDIFPDWAADLGVMWKGPHYWLFKAFARYQYSVAERIGIESPANRKYFASSGRQIEILRNWIDVQFSSAPLILPDELRDRRILVYAGNMGVAQDMDNLLRLARRLADRDDVRLLFIGSGTEVPRLQLEARRMHLKNVVFHAQVESDKLRQLLRSCHIGLLSLSPKLRTHNIPGKLLSYVEAGLPVLGSVNFGNELKQIVEEAGAGIVAWNGDDDALLDAATKLLDDEPLRSRLSLAARRLCETQFSSSLAGAQVERFFVATNSQ